ncbi:hypothetical protein [Marinobacterium lutimaris]|uniref:Uncharacterized protein n=1 Tax=Marinobacterium lutimaris TaxID=568106 RepID=A0A1H6D776_9GAMM|nr:hypothetical protein [Marinobacterium lutimaris]SEG81101.1 hypothetical protein SAMN05444390_105130 [Marinobacterium lutimaris]
MPVFKYLSFCFLLLLAVSRVQAAEVDRPIEDFMGHYIGHADSEDGIGRDMSVTIGDIPGSDDYFVEWSTVIHKSKTRTKRVTYNIRFQQSGREGIDASAMAKDVFGKSRPLDPLNGDPLVWARVKGNTHVVYALIITEDGGYDLQVYSRTLNAEGLWLEFTRQKDDLPKLEISAQLVRVSK